MSASDPAPSFTPAALVPALAGVVGSVVGARIVASQLLDRFDVPAELFIVAFYTMLFGGLWITARRMSQRFGSGNAPHDFGLSWTPRDILRGLFGFVVARLFQVLTILPFGNHLDRLRRFTEGLEHVSVATFVIFAVVAVVGAPIVEELIFRGLLQRSLTARVGSTRAVVLQAGLFGLYHVTPGLGFTNVPYALSLAAAGLVLGWLAERYGRLGPSSSAHFFVNSTSVLILWTAR